MHGEGGDTKADAASDNGALHPLPVPIDATENPITGVETFHPSRTTGVTGILLPQQNPAVNTAVSTLKGSEPPYCKEYHH